MPPIRSRNESEDDGVIELSSSPPPFIPASPKKRRVTRASSRAASLEPAPGGSTVNGKGKAPRVGTIIELTDSEDEFQPRTKGKGKAKANGPTNGVAGSSNVAEAKPRRRTELIASKAQPLFLRSPERDGSDDEDGEDLGGDERDDEDREMEAREDQAAIDEMRDFIDEHEGLQPGFGNPFEPFNAAPNVNLFDQPAGQDIHAIEGDDLDEDMRMAIALSLEESARKKSTNENRADHRELEQDERPLVGGSKGKGKARAVDDPRLGEGAGSTNGQPTLPVGTPSNEPAVVDAEPLPIDAAPPPSPRTTALVHILEIIPNIQPEYVQGLIEAEIAKEVAKTLDVESQERAEGRDEVGAAPTVDGIRVAQQLVGTLLEEGGWPKMEKGKGKGTSSGTKGKRKSDAAGLDVDRGEGGSGTKKPRVDWKDNTRPWQGGQYYIELALIHLQTSFPLIPKAHLRRQLQLNNSHYAPAHIALRIDEDNPTKRKLYVPKATLYHATRDLAKAKRQGWNDPTLDEERKWIEEWEAKRNGNGGTEPIEARDVQGKGKEKVDEGAVGDGNDDDDDDDEELADGEGIECQCCFAEYSFAKMVQCPEAHLFCKRCISTYAATKLGGHDASLVCMHSDGCAEHFPVSELRRVLAPKLMQLYDRLKQRKEIDEAGLEGLEECPFCDFKCVIERSFEEEKLFRCGNEDGGCGIVSCRKCRKEDHLPKSCEEVEQDKHLNGQHAVEEAMTRALMRNCPKCKKPFVKEAGCNKMTCPHCRTLSCYVCRQIIHGYDHFNQQQPNQPGPSRNSGKCSLWEEVEKRHADEVKAAAERAMADLKESHPEADADKIKVDIPQASAPPPPPAAYPGMGAAGMLGLPVHNPFNVGAFGIANPLQFNFNFGAAAPPLPQMPLPVPAIRGRRGARGRNPAPLPAAPAMRQPAPPIPRGRRGAALPVAAAPIPLPAPVPQARGYAGLHHVGHHPMLNANLHFNQARAQERQEVVAAVGGGNAGDVRGLRLGEDGLPNVNEMLRQFVAAHPEQTFVPRADQLQNMMRWRRHFYGPDRGMGRLFQPPPAPALGVGAPRNFRLPIQPLADRPPRDEELGQWLIGRPEQHGLPRQLQAQNMMRWNRLQQPQRWLDNGAGFGQH